VPGDGRCGHDGRVSVQPEAVLGGRRATGLLTVSSDPAALSAGGRWAVALPYSGDAVFARFANWSPSTARSAALWRGPDESGWSTSMDEDAYLAGVEAVREAIAVGSVYQANLCRVLSARLPNAEAGDIAGLHARLVQGNPAPFGGYLRLPGHDVAVVSASPELFLSVTREGGSRMITSGPIKGTAVVSADLSDKDRAENIMIVDLVRNDLSQVCEVGSVSVPSLLGVEEHPGLVHLVSRVRGRLSTDVGWDDILRATFPPGSVTGAPKSSALRVISALEPVPREFYCGAFGWIDADTGEAELAVAIRTFWVRDGVIRFGTGAGITWGSDAVAEWEETELKARRLVRLASDPWEGDAP
jgi:para-aminobenzoate synthetase component I